jgi:hypothetical protein
MEPVTAAVAAGLIMKYLVPAIKDLGEKVLETSEDTASNAAVAFGRRLLRTLLRRRGPNQTRPEVTVLEVGVERRVLAMVRQPEQKKLTSQLEGAIEDLLSADPALLVSITGLLNEAPKELLSQGDRSSYVGRDNSGAIITGDGNAVTYWR